MFTYTKCILNYVLKCFPSRKNESSSENIKFIGNTEHKNVLSFKAEKNALKNKHKKSQKITLITETEYLIDLQRRD